uniref:ORF0 n=1 Tax=Cereal yellow dwarf virus RPS TaxID=228582 RepID=A0A7R7YGU0_9VIRU|nr:ORF0 [Cereal yellow dwarf virus RPS]
MFVATPCGRITVVLEDRVYPFNVRYAAYGLNNLFHAACLEYGYGPHEIQLFGISLAYIFPLLLSGKSYGRGGIGISFPISYQPHLLQWGLALGYTPSLSTTKRRVCIELCTMSSQESYRAQFTHALTYGREHFLKVLETNLREIERNRVRSVWTTPMVPRVPVDRCSVARCVDNLLGRNRLLLTGLRADLTRYYNELDLESVEVDLWYYAGITLHHAGEKYLSGSYLQKVLQ